MARGGVGHDPAAFRRTFSLLTKRAERIKDCLPRDWGDGWDNVSFSVSCENQKRLEQRIPYLLELPAKHRWVSLKPFIGEIDIADYLATGKIETVLAGGENYLGSRPLHYEWVEKVYRACMDNNVQLIFGHERSYGGQAQAQGRGSLPLLKGKGRKTVSVPGSLVSGAVFVC